MCDRKGEPAKGGKERGGGRGNFLGEGWVLKSIETAIQGAEKGEAMSRLEKKRLTCSRGRGTNERGGTELESGRNGAQRFLPGTGQR